MALIRYIQAADQQWDNRSQPIYATPWSKSQQPQQDFGSVQPQAGKAADHRAVETDILQIPADIDFDERDQLPHVPGLDLIGDKARYATFLVGDKASEHDNQSLIDLGAQFGISRERLACFHEHSSQMLLQDVRFAAGAALDERARVGPDIPGEFGEFGTSQQVAFQRVDAIAIAAIAAEPVDERQHHAIEFVTEWMAWIGADLFKERGGGRNDLVHQVFVGPIKPEKRRQFATDFLAPHRHGFGLGQRLMNDAQDVVEQALVPTLLYEGAQRPRGERRQIDRLQLGGDAAADERHQARRFGSGECFGQQPKRETGEIGAALAVAQPVGNERAEIDLSQLGFDRCRFEKMHLDEFAEFVRDALLVALDDRRVRDRQPQGPAK